MAKFTDPEIAKRLLAARKPETIELQLEDGAPIRVAVRLLSEAEVDASRRQAQVDVRAWAKQRGYDPNSVVDLDPDMLERAVQRQVICRAFYDAETLGKDKPEPFFPSTGDLDALAPTTTQALWEAYAEHQARVVAGRTATRARAQEVVESMLVGDIVASLAGAERSELVATVQELVAVIRATRQEG